MNLARALMVPSVSKAMSHQRNQSGHHRGPYKWVEGSISIKEVVPAKAELIWQTDLTDEQTVR